MGIATESTFVCNNNAQSLPANGDRQGLIVGNPSASAMIVRLGGAAADATSGIPLPAGQALRLDGYTGAVSVFCGAAATAYAYSFNR